MGMFWGCLITFPKVTVTTLCFRQYPFTVFANGMYESFAICLTRNFDCNGAQESHSVCTYLRLASLDMPLTQDYTTDSGCKTVLRPNSQVNEYIYEFKMFSVVLLFYFVCMCVVWSAAWVKHWKCQEFVIAFMACVILLWVFFWVDGLRWFGEY